MTEYKRGFKTRYKGHDGEEVDTFFDSKIDNDNFANAMKLMGVTNVTKHWYSWAMKDWFRYHKESQVVLDNAGD